MDRREYIDVVNKMDLSNKDRSVIIKLFDAIKSGEGATSNYNDLENKPSINGITIKGNITSEQLGIPSDVANALLKTKQTLTTEEQSQVQTNIGVKDTVDVMGIESTEDIPISIYSDSRFRLPSGSLSSAANPLYFTSNPILINKGDIIICSTRATTSISLLNEVLHDSTFVKSLFIGKSASLELNSIVFIAKKTMYVEISGTKAEYKCKIIKTKVLESSIEGGYNRALFISAGAVPNENGTYSYNGLNDITEDEMADIYNESKNFLVGDVNVPYSNANMRARTLLVSIKRLDAYAIAVAATNYNGKGKFSLAVKLEVLSFPYYSTNYCCKYNPSLDMFNGCTSLKKILNPICLEGLNNSTFANCSALQEVKLVRLKESVSFANSPLLSKESILYIIQNSAATSAITITLHADAYSMAIADEDIQAALEEKTYVSLASA